MSTAKHTPTTIGGEWIEYKRGMHSRGIGGKDYSDWLRDNLLASRNAHDDLLEVATAVIDLWDGVEPECSTSEDAKLFRMALAAIAKAEAEVKP